MRSNVSTEYVEELHIDAECSLTEQSCCCGTWRGAIRIANNECDGVRASNGELASGGTVGHYGVMVDPRCTCNTMFDTGIPADALNKSCSWVNRCKLKETRNNGPLVVSVWIIHLLHGIAGKLTCSQGRLQA